MVGGMNSMLQLGFAGISLTVFLQNLIKIIKTSYIWLKTILLKSSKYIVNLPVIRLLFSYLKKLKF